MENYVWDYRNPYEWMQRVRSSSLPPMIVCCAITGGQHGKEANPNLPETAEEQAQQAYDAYNAGASMIHIHARNPDSNYLTTAEGSVYRNVNALVRQKCPDVIINNSTGGGPGLSLEQRMQSLEGDPEMASLNLGPFVLKLALRERRPPLPHPRPEMAIDACLPTGYGDVARFATRMREKGIKPELEVYHPGMYWVMQDLISQNLIQPPYLVQFVMGFQTSSYPTPKNVMSMIDELPANSLFEVIGTGPFQLPMTALGIIMGGHVRVGMEDNVMYARGRPLKSNAEAVERVVRIAREFNREIATPKQAREMLGLSATPSQYP
jgi:3-keto-5-aminohexanoate cleavage enzyme